MGTYGFLAKVTWWYTDEETAIDTVLLYGNNFADAMANIEKEYEDDLIKAELSAISVGLIHIPAEENIVKAIEEAN